MTAILKHSGPSPRNVNTASNDNRHQRSDNSKRQHHEANSSAKAGLNHSNNAGWRSRGWTPLKYPKSALVLQESAKQASNVYFPLHQDVLLASVRELLILDDTLDGTTLRLSHSTDSALDERYKTRKKADANVLPRYSKHLEPHRWRMLQTAGLASVNQIGEGNGIANSQGKKRKRPDSGSHDLDYQQPPTKHRGNVVKSPEREEKRPISAGVMKEAPGATLSELTTIGDAKKAPSAEQIAATILLRARIVDSNNSRQWLALERITDRPPSCYNDSDSSMNGLACSDPALRGSASLFEEDPQDISHFLNLLERTADGSFVARVSNHDIPPMIHTSISTEAILRDAAMTITTQLVDTFSDSSLRLFLGYKKTPAVVGRERLIRLLAAFLFDASHAMFAWEQTEQEVLSDQSHTGTTERDIDTFIKKSLFDARALRKIGGFEPSSLLPHAISIGRLRRRNLVDKKHVHSWEYFASTAQGKRMLGHHSSRVGSSVRGCKSSVISVGKQRRGQRLRQRHWLTSTLLWNEAEGDSSSISSSSCPAGTRSRTSSIASYEEAANSSSVTGNGQNWAHIDNNVDICIRHQARILAEMPGTMALSLAKESLGKSWGVLLAKEGNMCVVDRAAKAIVAKPHDQQLQCGDLIVHVQNEKGQEASTPMCVTGGNGGSSLAEHKGGLVDADWFRAVVDIFKQSQELHLIVQRVGVSVS